MQANTNTNHSTQNEASDRIFEKIRSLAPTIAARAGEAETAARIPADILGMLKSAGIFRMTSPKTYGGMELDYPTVARVLQAIAKIDGSIGWVCTLANGGALFCHSWRARSLRRYIATVRICCVRVRASQAARPSKRPMVGG